MGRVQFDPPRHGWRRTAWWAVLGVASVGIATGWWWPNERSEATAAGALATAAIAVAPAVQSPKAVAPGVAPKASSAAASTRPPQTKDERLEVCGFGLVDEQQLLRLLPQQSLFDARQRLVDALLGGSERERMTGLLMQGLLAHDRLIEPTLNACGQDDACRAAVSAQPMPQIDAAAQAMVELAERSSDAWLYKTAIDYACSGGVPGMRVRSMSCSRLTPSEWLKRDPGNAAPWLLEADRAAARGDAAGVEAALQAASRQPSLDLGFAAPHGPLLMHAEFQRLTPAMRTFVMTALWGATAAVPGQSLMQTVKHCRGEALDRPGRREDCDGLARLFTGERATTIHHAIGTRIAGWVGWPAERVRALEDEKAALQHWQIEVAADAARMLSCDGIQRREKHDRDIAAFGEVEALRRQMKADGRSITALAAEARRRQHQR
jgi:hypothetical protein